MPHHYDFLLLLCLSSMPTLSERLSTVLDSIHSTPSDSSAEPGYFVSQADFVELVLILSRLEKLGADILAAGQTSS